MESERRRVLTRRRKPLADCTNASSSPSSVPLKPSKSNLSSSSSCSSASNKPLRRRASTTDIPPNLNALNPSSPRTPAVSATPSPKPSSLDVTVDVEAEAEAPVSVFYSRKRSSNKRKDRGKEVADEGESLSSSWEKSDGVESEKLPKALTVPLIKMKRQRPVSSEKDELKDPVLQDFIEEKKAYFKMIDEFQLSEEEVESEDELD